MFNDQILNNLIEKYPAPLFSDRSKFLFEDLIDTIISQQLSNKAASTILNRFKNLFGNTFPAPSDVLITDDKDLRNVGISYPKIKYIKNVAQAFIDKEVVVEEIVKADDEEVIKILTKIKGIGRWSAEMILIFTLNRSDVFSFGDLGIKNAIKNLYNITDMKDITKLSEKWRPNRSIACWYLWRSLENN